MTIYNRSEITEFTKKLGRTKLIKSWVYFVTDYNGKHVKIGVTNSLMGRLSTFMSGLDTAVFSTDIDKRKLYIVFAIPGEFELENALHKKFKKDRHKGEWFHFTQEIEDCINYLDHFSYLYYYYRGDIDQLTKDQFNYAERHESIGRLPGYMPKSWDAFILHIIQLNLQLAF